MGVVGAAGGRFIWNGVGEYSCPCTRAAFGAARASSARSSSRSLSLRRGRPLFRGGRLAVTETALTFGGARHFSEEGAHAHDERHNERLRRRRVWCAAVSERASSSPWWTVTPTPDAHDRLHRLRPRPPPRRPRLWRLWERLSACGACTALGLDDDTRRSRTPKPRFQTADDDDQRASARIDVSDDMAVELSYYDSTAPSPSGWKMGWCLRTGSIPVHLLWFKSMCGCLHLSAFVLCVPFSHGVIFASQCSESGV